MSRRPGPPDGPRARNRAELTARIADVARARLATDGPAALSVRAVARDLGVVSSAVYRYVPSRDVLLTRLIVEAYDALGDRAEGAEAAVPRADHGGRLTALAHAVRDWALAAPHEWALVFGSPVPGYAAPHDTVDPAARVPRLLIAVLGDAAAAGVPLPHPPVPGPSPTLRADLARLRDTLAVPLDDAHLLRALQVWAQLIGLVSLELFGHIEGVVTARREHFAAQVRNLGADLGF